MAKIRPGRNTKLYMLIAAGVIFISFVLSLLIFHFATLNENVPKLRGLNIAQAETKIAETSFKVKTSSSKFNQKYKKGTIVSQTPSPNTKIRKGNTIFVILSKGPKNPQAAKIIIPDIKNKPYKDASKILIKLGFVIKIKKYASSNKQKNLVINQSPVAGSKVKKGSKITLVVSKSNDIKPAPLKKQENKQVTSSTQQKTICIDPGHQSHANLSSEPIGPGSSTTKAKVSGGATGISTGVPEYKITLAISLKLKTLLKKQGFKVVMTRQTNDVNISNSQRAQIANNAKAGLFIRIHADSSTNQSINGYSVLYPEENKWTTNIANKSKEAAQIVSEKLSPSGAKNKGIVSRGDITGFNWSKVPVILVETGFLSNSYEDKLLNNNDYQQKIAKYISSGITSFLSKN